LKDLAGRWHLWVSRLPSAPGCGCAEYRDDCVLELSKLKQHSNQSMSFACQGGSHRL